MVERDSGQHRDLDYASGTSWVAWEASVLCGLYRFGAPPPSPAHTLPAWGLGREAGARWGHPDPGGRRWRLWTDQEASPCPDAPPLPSTRGRQCSGTHWLDGGNGTLEALDSITRQPAGHCCHGHSVS